MDVLTLMLARSHPGGRGHSGLVDQLANWVVHAAIWRLMFRLPVPALLAVLIVGVGLMWLRRRTR